MFHAAIPMKFWDFIFESVVFVINRLPPAADQNGISPYEKLFHHKPDYDFLHVLGCACFPLLRPYNKHKLQPRSAECVFLGYSTTYKGYYCLHVPSNRMYVSRHVKFDERQLPFKQCEQTNQSTPPPIEGVLTTLTIVPSCEVPHNNHDASSNLHSSNPQQSVTIPAGTSTDTNPTTSQTPIRIPESQPSAISHHMLTRSKTNNLKPKKYPNHQAHTVSTQYNSDYVEPTCYSQAVKSKHWREAMANELSALAKNSTWQLVPPPLNAHVIGAKWLFKVKHRADGTIERYKARLVAKGYNQQEGIDYYETFSPVVKPATIRIVLTVALSNNWPFHQLDVNNAFLHGDLVEEVYMEQPPGFSDSNYPNYVCKLKKALYGLKQAPRAWFSKLKSFLLSHHFISSQADNSLFFFHSTNTTIYVLVYVDDILITGNNTKAINELMQALDSQFSIKNLGHLNYFLGIEVTNNKSQLHLSQTRYLNTILHRASMHNAKPCQTPMEAGLQLSKFSGAKMSEPQLYRSIVGALQYATITRPDITFAVNKASQFMAEPTEEHWKLVKRILRYIQGSLDHGITLKSAPHLSLHGYCDADWAGCPDDRRSTTGYAIFLGPNLISWSSKKQATVSRSSTEAEYRSLAMTTSELLWISYLLAELKYSVCQQPTLWCDNLGATFLASNPVFHARTKHIELDFHFVREKIQNKQLSVKFICSADQIGDIFTKGLAKARYHLLRDKLTVFAKQSSLRGAVENNQQQSLERANTESTGEDEH
ncbi:polyprotein [Rhynchospora pubera]|uniref:Polyprotein n=1 Tax=Rhynchospora pubera TaxID=906938 RepID=A0AAV8EFW6_9POAL|nr:polyprotein [Rhynchospora pubera]